MPTISLPLLSKILGGTTLLGLVAIGILYALWQGALDREETLATWQADIVESVQVAAGNPAVTADTADRQIQELGKSLQNALNAIGHQNKAIERLGEAKLEADARAEAEARSRAAAIKRADTLAAQLAEEAKTPYSKEDLDAEIRRIQNQLYDAGL